MFWPLELRNFEMFYMFWPQFGRNNFQDAGCFVYIASYENLHDDTGDTIRNTL